MGTTHTKRWERENPTGRPWSLKPDAEVDANLVELGECVLDAGSYLSSSDHSYWGCWSSGFEVNTRRDGSYVLTWRESDGCWGPDPIKGMSHKEERDFYKSLPTLIDSIIALAQERGLPVPIVGKVVSPLRATVYLGD